MNKYDKALSRMYSNLHIHSEYFVTDKCDNDYNTLYELIKKTTPKKPIMKYKAYLIGPDGSRADIYIPHCPNCKDMIDQFVYVQYCPFCGQALDWGEEDDN